MSHSTIDPAGSRPGQDDGSPVLSVRGLTKNFGGRAALDGLDLTIGAGEVHALLGENGSGKSTFIKLLSGYHTCDRGSVAVAGADLPSGSPTASYAAGCRFVYQDVGGLIDTLSIADNLSLVAGYPTRLGTVRHRVVRRQVLRDLERAGVTASPSALVAELSPATKTGVAVARVLHEDEQAPARLLVFDEPTATLPAHEVNQLLDIVRAVSGQGLGVLYVTHRLEEVFQIADRVTILRDGVRVGTWPVGELTRDRVVDLMTGSELDDVRRSAQRLGEDPHVELSVRDVSGPSIDRFSMDVHRGEIVGVAGVVGSGRESLLGALFGAIERHGGSVSVGGEPLRPARPDRAVQRGIGYLPADRRSHGLVAGLSARENLTLCDLGPFWNGANLSRSRETSETKHWFAKLGVRPADATEMLLENFSGGNQQKVLLARLLRCRPRVLLLDEPTHGVDIAAKAEIHRQILDASSAGTSVVVASSDVDELVALCHRVVVMWHGRNAGEWTGPELTVGNVAKHTSGIGRNERT